MANVMNNFFKTREREFREYLPEKPLAIVRLDGKAFHTFTKNFERPFDFRFIEGMNSAALAVINKVINSAEFAYVQSDEISLFFTNSFSEYSDLPFNGRIEKILSTSASAATGGFMKSCETEDIPVFDARVLTVDNLSQLDDYLTWRRMDARKNAISMAAEANYSHKQLIGKSTNDRWEMLQSTDNAVLPDDFMWGRLIVKEYFTEEVTFTNPKTKTEETVEALRARWVVKPAVREVAENVIKALKQK